MTQAELLNQVAEKLERCEYTPIVTTKEELPIWTMLLNKVYEETFNTKEKMTPKEKAQDLWLRYYELIDDDYSNEAAKKMAKEYAQIAVDEIMKSLDDVLHPNPFGQYWNKVKQEIENL